MKITDFKFSVRHHTEDGGMSVDRCCINGSHDLRKIKQIVRKYYKITFGTFPKDAFQFHRKEFNLSEQTNISPSSTSPCEVSS